MTPPGTNDRWARGLPHHPVAAALFRVIERADWEHSNDSFCWKSGGDGDNGEALMYAVSALLEADPSACDELRAALGSEAGAP